MDNYSSLQQDILKEVATICAGNASKALSLLVEEKIEVMVPKVSFLPLEKAPEFFGQKDDMLTVVSLKIFGDLEGKMILVFSETNAKRFASSLIDKLSDKGEGIHESALKEVGNILCGAALNSFSKFLGLSLIQAIPNIETETVSQTIRSSFYHMRDKIDNILLFKITLIVENTKISADLYFLFDLTITDKILAAVQNKVLTY